MTKIKRIAIFIILTIILITRIVFEIRATLAWQLPKELESKPVLISGKIVELPITKKEFTSFILETKKIDLATVETRIKLSWYQNPPELFAGDRLELFAKLKRPHGTMNPGGFDWELELFSKKIRASGYVINSKNYQIAHEKSFSLNKLRQTIEKQIDLSLSNRPLKGVIEALIVGEEGQISNEQWQVLQSTGTSYLVAIAGLHVGLVAVIVFGLVNFFWRCSKRLPLVYPASQVASIASFLGAFFYGLTAGFPTPTKRALVMLAVWLASIIFKKNIFWFRILLLAFFSILLIDPLAIFTCGFWLSFSAVFFLAYDRYGTSKKIIYPWWKKYLRIQVILTFSLMPLALFWFEKVSLLGVITNIIAFPGVCLVVVPLALLGSYFSWFYFPWGKIILLSSEQVMELIWWWLELFNNCSIFIWQHVVFNILILLAAVIGILLLLAPRAFPARFFGAVWLCPLFFLVPEKPKTSQFWFTLLDVGQGLSAVVQTANHVLVYDTGPKFLEGDSGERVVAPFLLSQGIKKVDLLLVSHGDSDHSGGVESLLKNYPAQEFLTSVPEKLHHQAKNCFRGQNWVWDGVSFEILSPEKVTSFAGNAASCVLKVSDGKNSLLLTGDIEKETEEWMLQNEKEKLHAEILVAPHHGSSSSSSDGFVSAVKPRYVLFPVGYLNRFSFPKKEVLAKYQKINAQLFDTANSGAIKFKVDPEKILEIDQYRLHARRFWND
jgi:competence protein ComEC